MNHRTFAILATVGLLALAILRPAPPPPISAALTASSTNPPLGDSPQQQTRRRSTAARAVVYVAGAVRHPGLYTLAAGSRAAEAVRLAGGLTASADTLAVNLAAPVRDGDEVGVPEIVAACPRRTSRRRAHSARTRHASRRVGNTPTSTIDVNTADTASLAAVPGIGPAVAERIVAIRSEEGPFADLDELLDVAGMTPARLERARPYLAAPR